MFLSSKSNYPIGLDISSNVLRLVQLNKVGKKNKIQAISKIEMEKGLIVDGEIKDEDAVLEKINQLIRKPLFGKVSSDRVVACLPETKTFVKLIKIEKSPNQISEIIESEIEKHIPYAINEVYFDWQSIHEGDNDSLVLIGATPKEIVNQYTNLLDRAKLSIQALEIEPVSICRCLLAEERPDYQSQEQGNYALIDIGANRTSMVVYSRNTVVFTVSMPISGEKITQNIAKELDMDIDQAEKAKIICGLDKTKAQGVINKVLSDNIDELKKKIEDSMDFYDNYYGDRGPLNKIILCGGGANLKGLSDIIKEATSTEVLTGDVFVNLGERNEEVINALTETHSFKNKLDNKKTKDIVLDNKIHHQDMSFSFVTAIGLALRGIFINE